MEAIGDVFRCRVCEDVAASETTEPLIYVCKESYRISAFAPDLLSRGIAGNILMTYWSSGKWRKTRSDHIVS